MSTYVVDENVARDAMMLIKGIAYQINHEPVAELRLGHEAVKEILAIANRMHEKEPKT
jgi:hypothetical protein